MTMEYRGMSHFVSWISLLVSVLALILGWTAYNRTGMDLENQAQRQVVDTREDINRNINRGLVVAEAKIKLALILTAITANQGFEQAASQIPQIRNDLREAYQDAEGQSLQAWRQMDQNLEKLEGQLRNRSADALQTVQNIIGQMKQEVRQEGNQS